MRLAAVGIALGLLAAPAGAQSRFVTPAPRPARLLWGQTPVEPFIQDTLPRATTGAGTATIVGAFAGGLLGFLLTNVGCGLDESGDGCGAIPYLIGLIGGGVTGAMIGSAFEGDQPPKEKEPAAAPPPP